MQITKTGPSAAKINIVMDKAPFEWWCLCRSDAHHDNIHCNQEMEFRHLDEAKAKGAGIIDLGDLHCAMQGKFDPRSSKDNLRPQHKVSHYLDALVSTAADDYEPYAKNWLSMGHGNHETAIIKNHETDLTQRLAGVLNDRTGSNIQTLGYTGFIRFIFENNNKSMGKHTKTLYYNHGSGGGGPISEFMIKSSRTRMITEGVDLYLQGHIHYSGCQEFIKQRLNNVGQVVRRQGWFVQLPTYKDAYGTGQGGFEVERGHGPRPIGAWWLKFTFTRKLGLRVQVVKAD